MTVQCGVRQRTDAELPTVLQIGSLYWQKLGDLTQADEFYKRVRKTDPAHPDMLEFYRALYGPSRPNGTADDASKLLQVLTQAQKTEHDAQSAKLLSDQSPHRTG